MVRKFHFAQQPWDNLRQTMANIFLLRLYLNFMFYWQIEANTAPSSRGKRIDLAVGY
jgi:hypothetical protein